MTFDLDTELKRKGMTGRDLARSVNCEEATISRYRRGLEMTDYHERAIAEALGLLTHTVTRGEVQVSADV